MNPVEIYDALLAARRELDTACRLLESPAPAALDSCAEALRKAIDGISRCRNSWSIAGTGAAVELRRIRTRTLQAGRLLQLAAAYRLRWREIVATMCAGYGAHGAPAAIAGRPKISVEV
jgi:hypothetical protein